MRQFAFVTAFLAASAALAATSAERLKPYSVLAARHGGTIRSSFDPPTVAAERDLRTSGVAVRVGDEAPATFDARTPGMRIHRSGLRARYAAPKRSGGRVARFTVSLVAGAFNLSLKGGRIESKSPPLVELSLGGHVYLFDPAFPDGPPAPFVPLPTGTVEFTTCTRSKATFGSEAAHLSIRSLPELGTWLQTVTLNADDIAVLQQNDYSRNMVLVAFGTGAAQGDVPLAVRITNVASDGRTLSVGYDQYVLSSGQSSQAGPARSAFFHAIAVPTSGMPVQFTGTTVPTSNPWN
jgi:hypothetical protein